MQRLKLMVLVLIAVLIIINGWFYMAWISLEKTLFSSAYYSLIMGKTELIKPLHQVLQLNLAYLVEGSLTGGDYPEPVENGEPPSEEEIEAFEETRRLQAKLVVDVLVRTFDQPWFKEQLLLAVEDLLSLPDSERSALSIAIDLRDKKEEIQRTVIIAMKALPENSLSELGIDQEDIDLEAELLMAEIDIPDYYRPADSLAWLGLLDKTEVTIEALWHWRGLMRYWPIIIVVLLAVAACMTGGLKGGLQWVGWAMIISGVLFFGTLQFARVALSILLPGITEVTMAGQVNVSPDLLNSVANYTFAEAAAVPLAVAVIGLLSLIGGSLAGKLLYRLQR